MRRILSLLLLTVFLLTVLPSCADQASNAPDTEIEDIPLASVNVPEGGDVLSVPAPAPGGEEEGGAALLAPAPAPGGKEEDGDVFPGNIAFNELDLRHSFHDFEGVIPEDYDIDEDGFWYFYVTVEATGETRQYSIFDAKEHELTRAALSKYVEEIKVNTFMLYGIKVSDMLADLGVEDFSSVTVERDDGELFEYDKELVMDEGTLIGWIETNTVLPTFYASFGTREGNPHDYCCPIWSIVIHG